MRPMKAYTTPRGMNRVKQLSYSNNQRIITNGLLNHDVSNVAEG